MTDDPRGEIIDPISLPARWWKPLAWGAVIALLYLLRDFFLVGFLTFLICYAIRSVVGSLTRTLDPNHKRRWLDLSLTLSLFIALCSVLYAVGQHYLPQVIHEGTSLTRELRSTRPEEIRNIFLANTIGSWRLRSEIGAPGDARYDEAFRTFQESGRTGEGLLASIPRLSARLNAKFESTNEEAQLLALEKPARQGSVTEADFERRLKDLRNSSEYKRDFAKFYKNQKETTPEIAPIEFGLFQRLVAAHPKGDDVFLSEAVDHFKNAQGSAQDRRHDFETATRLRLGQQWWATSSEASWLREHAKRDGPRISEAILAWFEQALPSVVRVPIQIVMALVLAIFILTGWHELKDGAVGIGSSRLRPVFEEVAPNIVALGRLIGKSFQGQVVIALINSSLTLLALWLIGVDYKFVLTLIVFLLSFIPTIGVVLSAIPICVIALSQPGGSMTMAAQAIGAIVLIHLAEAVIFSPKISGRIGHLHPVIVVVILLVAGKLFGLWGLVLGVPVSVFLIRIVLLRETIVGINEPKALEQ